MEYLRRLIFRPRERRKRPTPTQPPWERQRPAALSLSVLNKAPMEILLCIADFLPPSDAVAFSLSCKHLKGLLGTREIQKIRSSSKDKLALLNLLARDLPDDVACSACIRLHAMQNLRRYSCTTYSAGSTIHQHNSLGVPACVSQDRETKTCAISDLFGTTAFKMAIKRYHQIPECTELLELMSSRALRITEIGDYIRQSREDCCVFKGRLIHRQESVYISRKCTANKSFKCHPSFVMICPHTKFIATKHSIATGVSRCQECRTEYRINLKHYDEHGSAMFLTRWKDFGVGPDDEVWAQHLPSSSAEQSRAIHAIRAAFLTPVLAQPRQEVWFQEENLSSAFENGDEHDFEALLTSENEAELFRFQKHCLAFAW